MNDDTDRADSTEKSLSDAVQFAKGLDLPDVDPEVDRAIEKFFEQKIDETNGHKL